MRNAIVRLLFIALFAALCIPLVQQLLPFADCQPLNGYFTTTTDTTFTWQGWMSGAYQEKKAAFLNDNTGFRSSMIRQKDQLDYSLFSKLNYSGAFVGKAGCLFYGDYVDAYTGSDYIGYNAIHDKMLRLKAIQDTLSRLGKHLVLVYNPSKASYCSNYLPDNVMKAGPANYETYLRIGDSLGINQVSFNSWFLHMKDTSKELLFGKAGIHWTVYGAVLAGDSLVRYIEHVRGIQCVHPTWQQVQHLYGARQSDDDIAKSANLMYGVDDERYAYPILRYTDTAGKKKPKVILIGDSFVINILNNELPQHTFSDWQFWFYFRYINDKNTQVGGDDSHPLIEHYNWQQAMAGTDCIVLMYTTTNLTTGKKQLGSGFIEQAYDYYYPGSTVRH